MPPNRPNWPLIAESLLLLDKRKWPKRTFLKRLRSLLICKPFLIQPTKSMPSKITWLEEQMQLSNSNKPKLMNGKKNVWMDQPPDQPHAGTLSFNYKISGQQPQIDTTASLHHSTCPQLMVSTGLVTIPQHLMKVLLFHKNL
jgi:hypothetical protein